MSPRVSLFFAMLLAVGCTHATRGPASDTHPPTCSELFTTTFNPDTLERSYELGTFVYSEMRKYTESKYPEWVRAFMAKVDRETGCENERDVDLYFADLASKIAVFNRRIRSNSEQTATRAALSRPDFNDARVAAQLACYSDCAYRVMQSTKPATQTCQEKCVTDPTLANFFENSAALKRLAQTCFAGVTDKTAAGLEIEYAVNYQKVIPAFLEKLNALESATTAELTSDRNMLAMLTKLRGDYLAWKSSRQATKCGPPNYAWLDRARKASVLLRSKDAEGSAFFVDTASGRQLVTAAHVSEPNIKLKVQQLMAMILVGGKAGKSVRFDLVPGMIALNGDVSIAKQEKGPALELADVDETPWLGQRFYIAGYPAFAADQFQVLRCTFYGFGRRLSDGNQTEGSYLLYCPGQGDRHGISGGPMLDEKGRVWGVNSVSVPYTSTMRVVPLAKGIDGKVKIGIQRTFLSDLCYDDWVYTPHRCQVMPNMYERNVP